MDSKGFAERYGPAALILGGSEGVGAALAQKLAERGLDLYLVARKPAALDATAKAIASRTGRRVRTLDLDLTAPDAVARIMAWVGGASIGFLACNAGAESRFAAFLDRPLEDSLRMLALNVGATTAITHGVAAGMAQRGRGAIVLVSSGAAMAGTPLTAVYAASKAYVNVLAEGLWGELQPRGVDVLGLVLGLTRTPAMERMGTRMDAGAADPAAVADEALAHLADGPLHYASGTGAMMQALRGMPRGEAVRLMGQAAAALK